MDLNNKFNIIIIFKLLRLKISPTCTKTQIILIYILISIKYQSLKTSKLLKGVPNPLKIDLDKLDNTSIHWNNQHSQILFT